MNRFRQWWGALLLRRVARRKARSIPHDDSLGMIVAAQIAVAAHSVALAFGKETGYVARMQLDVMGKSQAEFWDACDRLRDILDEVGTLDHERMAREYQRQIGRDVGRWNG
jgi:hypothetical protein